MFPEVSPSRREVYQWLDALLGIEEYVCEFVRMGVEAIGSQADGTEADRTYGIVLEHLRTYSGTAYEATQFGTAILAPIEEEMLRILIRSEPSTDLATLKRRVKEFINKAALQVVLCDEKFDLDDPELEEAIPLVIGKLTEQIKSTSFGKDNQALIVPIEPTIWNLFDLAKIKYLVGCAFEMKYSNAIDYATQLVEMTIPLDKIRSNVLTRTLAKLSGFAAGLIYKLNIDAAYAWSEEGSVKSTAGLKTILTALTGGLGIAVCLGGFLATAPPAIYEQLNPLNTAALRLSTTAGALTFLGISLSHWYQRYSFKRYAMPHEIIHLLAGAREKERRVRIAPPISTD